MPRITISINAPNETNDQELLTLDLPGHLTVADLKGFVQAETNFPTPSQHFYLNGQPLLGDHKTLEEAGIKDGEMLAMLIRRPGASPRGGSSAAQQQRRPGGRRRGDDLDPGEVETTRLRILGSPAALQQIRHQKPELAETVNDPVRFREVWLRLKREEEDYERERQNQIALLNEDPFNVEAQKRIEEMIRQERVIENLQHAYENNPEVFGRVHMLYIAAEVNGHPVKAFVDSGAQATIMSPSCALACNIMRLIDTRYSGIAKGVGTAKILGRVHDAEIKVGDAVMPCAFTVMEGKDVDLLFGLDMLKRYQAKIDLERGVLVLGGKGRESEVPFLPESEIPKYLDEAEVAEPTLAGPNGTEIGAKTGAVRPAGTAGEVVGQAGQGGANSGGGGPSGGSGSAVSQPPPQRWPQESVNQLVSLGFSPQEAEQALHAADGNVEVAAGLLFQ